MQPPPTPSPPSPISPTRTRLVPTLHPNPQPLTMPCSFAEAAAALSSADAGAAAPCATSARLIDNILNAKFTSIHALSSFAKNPQSVQLSRHESSAADWVPVSAKMSQQLDADHRHLTSEECAALLTSTSSPTCWADILLFFHEKEIPVFLPIPDLVLLSQASPTQWLFTGSSGRIMLKAQSSLNHVAIHKSFTGSTRTLNNTEGCAAIISHCDEHALQAGGDPIVSDILHEARFQQLCFKFMLPSFDPDTQPLPSWLTDRSLLQLYVKPRDDIGWETHTQRCRDVFSVCHRTFQFSYRYMSMKQRRVYRSNLEVVRLFPPLSDALRNELSRISVAVMRLFWRVRIGVDLVRCEFIKDYTGRLLLIKVSTHPNNVMLPPMAAYD